MIVGILHPDTKGVELKLAKESLKLKDEEFKIFNLIDINKNSNLYDEMIKDLDNSSGVIMHFHGSSAHLREINQILKKLSSKKFFINTSLPEEMSELIPQMNLSTEEFQNLYKYFQEGGKVNTEQFIKLAFNIFEKKDYKINPLIEKKLIGIYDDGHIVDDNELYIEDLLKKNLRNIGIIVNASYIGIGNTLHIDMLIEKLKKKNLGVIAIYGRLSRDRGEGVYDAMNKFFYKDGKLIVDSIISLSGYSLSTFYVGENRDFEISLFEKFNVPVFQAMTTYLTEEDFKEDPQGIDIVSLSLNIYQPEMDGQIITLPIATKEKALKDGVLVDIFKPIEDRIDTLVDLVDRFSILKNKENKDKKIALILHNYPPRNDMIGSAHGLDTPESLFNLLNTLKENDYNLNNSFHNGQEIIDELIKRGANDWRFQDDDNLKEHAVFQLDKKQYSLIFNNLDPLNKEDMLLTWGEIPGKSMVIDGKQIIPGILDNNIFIGLQPKRAPKEDVEESYHSLRLPPPHSYIGFYKWIDEIFKADAIIHIGTHGTLEWLPGKEVALSRDSYPDINIGSIPHLYIYNLGILGEGMQTRRRAHSAVLSHMIPSFDESGTYEYLEEIEELLKKLDHASKTSPGQIEEIKIDIFDIAKKEGITSDLGIEDDKEIEDSDLEKIHNYIHLIKNSITRDGLHIYGKIPEGNRYLQLLRGLSMIGQNGSLGLKDAIIKSLGYSYENIRDSIRDMKIDNSQNYEVLEKSTEISVEIINKWSEYEFSYEILNDILKNYDFIDTYEVKESLKFIKNEVVPRLDKTYEELLSFSRGLKSEFIMPSLGGNPTRGNINLLPTGRNFYSIRPEAVPTRQAYKIGKELGDIQIRDYKNEKGEYPESIGIIVYSTNTMKTYGEDIGEILYLMGLEPEYIGNSEIVSGVKVIPYEKLNRPRIDVTLRISGLFRDTFPNLINLMDDAVEAVISLDEPEEINPIKYHVMKDLEKLMEEGISEKSAREYSKTRVYSAPAGIYGAGVSDLIESKEWEDLKDLADAYIDWSSHGYSRNLHGEKMKSQMKHILKRTTMTIKNEVSREIDLLDSDDFYNYHGGLIAAVRKESEDMPYVAIGNTADPRYLENRDLNLETSRIMRSKVLNPKWLEGLKKHGYKGASEISKTVDVLFGWDATSDNGEDWMYQKIAERFLFDKETLEWMSQVNKTAVFQISERLLEAIKRDMWDTDKETADEIAKIYLNAEGTLEDI